MRFFPSYDNFKKIVHSAATTHLPNALSAAMASLQLSSSVKDLDLRVVVLSSLVSFLPGLSRVLTPNTGYKQLLNELSAALNRIDQRSDDPQQQEGAETLKTMSARWAEQVERYAQSLPRTDHSLRVFYGVSLALSITSTAFALTALGVYNNANDENASGSDSLQNQQAAWLNLLSASFALGYVSLSATIEFTLATLLQYRTDQLQSILSELTKTAESAYAVLHEKQLPSPISPNLTETVFPTNLKLPTQETYIINTLTRTGDWLYQKGRYTRLATTIIEAPNDEPAAATTSPEGTGVSARRLSVSN